MDIKTIQARLSGLAAIGPLDFTQNLFLNSRPITDIQLQADLLVIATSVFDNTCPTAFASYYDYFTNLVSLILMRLSNGYTISKLAVDKNGVDYIILSYFYAIGFRITDYFPTWTYPLGPNIKRVWMNRITDGTFTNGHLMNYDTYYIGCATVSSFAYDSVDIDMRMGIMNAFVELGQFIDAGTVTINQGVTFITDTNGLLDPHVANQYCDTFFAGLIVLFNKPTFGYNEFIWSTSNLRTKFAMRLLTATVTYMNMFTSGNYAYVRPLYDTKTNQIASAAVDPTNTNVNTTCGSETGTAMTQINDLNLQCSIDQASGNYPDPMYGTPGVDLILKNSGNEASAEINEYETDKHNTKKLVYGGLFIMCIAVLFFVNKKKRKNED